MLMVQESAGCRVFPAVSLCLGPPAQAHRVVVVAVDGQHGQGHIVVGVLVVHAPAVGWGGAEWSGLLL